MPRVSFFRSGQKTGMLWLHRQAVNTHTCLFKCPQKSAVAVLTKSSGGNVVLVFFNWPSRNCVPVPLKGCLLPGDLTRLHWSSPLSTPLSLSSFFSFFPHIPLCLFSTSLLDYCSFPVSLSVSLSLCSQRVSSLSPGDAPKEGTR